MLALSSCASEAAAARAESARAAVRAGTPQHFAGLLRTHYAAERACLERHFPATVILTPGDTSPHARADDERFTRHFEILRAAGLLEREEVRPGDRDWQLPPAAHVDSGGTRRIVRYVLTERARHDAEPVTVADGVELQLCYARRRLVAVDSIVTRGPSWGWSLEYGVNYSDAFAHVLQTVTFDSVSPWAPEVARRDSLRDLLPPPERLEGPQQLWATFWAPDGRWVLTSTDARAPQ